MITVAIEVLKNIVELYPNSPLKQKAERMIDVLHRRAEIEEYLTKLEITRAKEDDPIVIDNRQRMIRNDSNLIVSPKLFDSSKTIISKVANAVAKIDSTIKAPVIMGPYTLTLLPSTMLLCGSIK
jgi:hypothetical protein